MSIASLHIPSLGQFRKDTRLILIASGIFSLGFFGVQTLLKVLYVLRLGYGLEYVGLFTATSALTYMAMSLPSGALGNRYGLKPMMALGGALTTAGMLLLPMTEVMGTMVGGLLPLMFATILGQDMDGPAPYRWALLVGAGFGMAGMFPLLRVRIEDPVIVDLETQPHGSFPTVLVAVVGLHVILLNGASATCQSFCSAYMDTDLHLSTAAIGFLTATGQFLAVLAPLLMPYLGVRRSHAWTLMVASAGTAIMLLPLALIPTWQAAGFGRMGALALSALWMPTLQVFQMTVFEKHWRSLAYGAVSTGMGFACGSVSLAGGFIAAAWGYSSLFLLGAALAAGGAIAMWALRRHVLRTLPATVTTQGAPVAAGSCTAGR